MEMTLEARLQTLGLGPNEAKVYLAALKLGETSVGDLVRESGLHKQLVYNAAENLQHEGILIISEVHGRKHFTAADPAVLEQRIEERLGAVRGLLPALYQVASTKKQKDLVRTYTGLAAVQQYYQQSMRTQPEKTPVDVTGVGGQKFFELWQIDNPYFQQFENTRLARNIPLKLLFFLNSDQEASQLPGLKDRTDTQARIITGSAQAPIDIVVWHSHVGLLIYGKEPHLVDISGEQIVVAFRTYFELLWSKSSPIPAT